MDARDSDFQRIEEAARASGPQAALDALCEALLREKRYPHLFEALLMKSRTALGLPLIPLAPAQDLPEEVLKPHEDAIADACRRVGGLYLKDGDVVAAWPYFRALGETAPVAAVIDTIEPGSKRKDLEELIEIAFHQGVNPRRGLELVLANAGICSAITAMERSPPAIPRVGEDCVKTLVRALHDELIRSVAADVGRREGRPPPSGSRLPELAAPRPWLFADGGYHVDPSHLWSVVRLSASLGRSPELDLALDMADYGMRLAPLYHYKSEPPFEDFYADHAVYLRGRRSSPPEDNARAVEHFQKKVRAARARGETHYPVGEALTVLARLGRAREAVDLWLEWGQASDGGGPPTLGELCQMAGDFERLAEISRGRGDLLGFAAGLIQAQKRAAGTSTRARGGGPGASG